MPPAFSLQSVLDVRHNRVEALEIELGRLLAMQLNAQNLLAGLCETQKDLMNHLAEAQQGEIDLFKIRVLHDDLRVVGERMETVKEELSRLEMQIEKKRRDLVAARQEEETLQILRRKRLEAYQAEQERLEMAFQDDLYIAQAFRQRYQEIE
jgi:flagellar export protein FliJ